MDKLREDWLTEGLIDFEYKKYLLLGYLKKIKEKFSAVELYPSLSDLMFHYRNLEQIKNSKQVLHQSFPKVLKGVDLERLTMNYENLVTDDSVMEELASIIEYASSRLSKSIADGNEINDFVERNVLFEPVGIASIYENEGYLLIGTTKSKSVNIFRYQVTLYQSSESNERGVSTSLVGKESLSYSNSLRQIRTKLIAEYRDIPNPATFSLHSKMKFPVNATLLPIAKRLLIRSINVS